ncbi:MAG TPA: hypothetical protein VEX68_00470 [Bryobacteraceae bacterium]|nr:hypothetical protein [Bryobacteraceae bacterium]
MTKLLASRISVALTAALFLAATFMSASSNDRTTTIVLSQPEILDSVAVNR